MQEEIQQKTSNRANKTILWIIVVIVVIVSGLYFSGGLKEKTDVLDDTQTPNNEPALSNADLKPATGNIDDIIASIMVEASADGSAPSELDSSLTAAEDFGDLDQSLNTSGIE